MHAEFQKMSIDCSCHVQSFARPNGCGECIAQSKRVLLSQTDSERLVASVEKNYIARTVLPEVASIISDACAPLPKL